MLICWDIFSFLSWTNLEFYKGRVCVYVCVLSHFSHVQLFVTLWTVAHQVPLTMGFSSQEYWNGLSCPPPSDLSNPGMEPESLMSPALAGGFFTTSTTWEAYTHTHTHTHTHTYLLTMTLIIYNIYIIV